MDVIHASLKSNRSLWPCYVTLIGLWGEGCFGLTMVSAALTAILCVEGQVLLCFHTKRVKNCLTGNQSRLWQGRQKVCFTPIAGTEGETWNFIQSKTATELSGWRIQSHVCRSYITSIPGYPEAFWTLCSSHGCKLGPWNIICGTTSCSQTAQVCRAQGNEIYIIPQSCKWYCGVDDEHAAGWNPIHQGQATEPCIRNGGRGVLGVISVLPRPFAQPASERVPVSADCSKIFECCQCRVCRKLTFFFLFSLFFTCRFAFSLPPPPPICTNSSETVPVI